MLVPFPAKNPCEFLNFMKKLHGKFQSNQKMKIELETTFQAFTRFGRAVNHFRKTLTLGTSIGLENGSKTDIWHEFPVRNIENLST